MASTGAGVQDKKVEGAADAPCFWALIPLGAMVPSAQVKSARRVFEQAEKRLPSLGEDISSESRAESRAEVLA